MGLYNIFIVVDAGSDVGMGHLSRCTAFYDMFTQSGVSVEFLLDSNIDYSAFLGNRRYTLVNWHRDINLLKQYVTLHDFIFLDSLHIGQAQADLMASICNRLIVIDDYLRLEYSNAIIIDWTPNVENTDRHKVNMSKNILLLGARYAILREPFESYQYVPTYIGEPPLNILIVMGGCDVRNLTHPIVDAIRNAHPTYVVKYIDGKCNPVNADTMFSMMNEADIVISAAGQTLFELLKLRKPTIAIQVVDNQREDVEGMRQLGLFQEVYQWDDQNIIDKVLARVDQLVTPESRKQAIANIREITFVNTPEEVIKFIQQ